MKLLKTGSVLCLVFLVANCATFAVSVTGADWMVYYSLPDQHYTEAPGEYDIRNALLARINALQSGQSAVLATYSFSAAGTAGQILAALSNALDRGASIAFITDYAVDTNEVISGASLAALGGRLSNPLQVYRGTNSSGIMHHKFGLFDYGSTNRRVFVGSWNFTSAASYQQWNIAIDVTSPALYSAFTNEARELMAGRFHYDSAKSHAHDGARFRLTGDWGENWVRFAPYPNGSDGGSNALTDITNCIAGAQSEIVFALNMLTRPAIASALVSAADRGVQIHGVIPKSDQWSEGSVYSFLTNTTHYATTNRVQFETPYSKADGSAIDAGETDLVHSKWMAIDPWSERPMLIHGSANWTDAALASPSANDEYVLFLRHRDMTRMFYAQFKRITGLWSQRDDFWCDIGWTRGTLETGLWMTDAQEYILQRAEALGAWPSDGSSITGLVGRLSVSTNGLDSKMFYRALRK